MNKPVFHTVRVADIDKADYRNSIKLPFTILLSAHLLMAGTATLAASKEELAEMQRKLNAEVQATPFSVAEEAKIDAYITDSINRGIKPDEYTGKNWRVGYTCNDMARYSYDEYRNCRHYHRYYGRYYW
jgi:PBP1b-binding outer membrane lipoprotein LpoB